MHRSHRLLRAASRPVSVHRVGEARLEDGRQHQHRRRLYDAVADGRNPQRTLPDTSDFRNVHPPNRGGLIPARTQVFP